MLYLIGKHPFVKVKVKLPKGNIWKEMDFLIDTGFSGGLVLPTKFKNYFPPNEFIEARYLLADNSEVTVDTTYTIVEYKGKRKDVAVVFMGNSEALAGVEFIDQMKFCLDLKKNKIDLIF